MSYINSKRDQENLENEKRWKRLSDSYNQSQENLVNQLNNKERRSRSLLDNLQESRVSVFFLFQQVVFK